MKKALISSNGALTKTAQKVVFVEDGNLPTEFRKLTGIVFDGDVFYDTLTRLHGSDTVRISFAVSKACNIFGCYTTSSAQTNYSLYVSSSSSAKYTRYDGGTYSSYISLNTRCDVEMTPTGVTGMRTDSSWTEKSFTTESDMLIGATSIGATSEKLTGTVFGNVEIQGRAVYVPAERVSDGAIGYYELNSQKFFTNQGEGTPTALGYV